MEKDRKSSFQESGYAHNSISDISDFFTDVRPIKTTGTTCDTFFARYESRHVFVKRLKPEFASNSRYRLAFQKEYELGVTLRHPSIPQYIKFTGDTLITEFVDGKTLYKMLQDDPRLHSNANIEKWVEQLLVVMDYLHAANIIHCDIKTDNIMITNDTRNLMLIDFDKAFTASQDLTPGTPLNYGTEDENLTKRQMDLRGVTNILEKLLQYVDSGSLTKRIEKVVAIAGNPEVTMPELLDIWRQPLTKQSSHKTITKRNAVGWWIGAIILIALLVIVWSYFPKESSEVIQTDDYPVVENSEITLPEEGQQQDEAIYNGEEPSQPLSPDWNSLLMTDVLPINKLLNKISAEIQSDKVLPDSVANIVLLINDEMNSFNEKVRAKYSSEFPEFNQMKLMEGIYESQPVKSMVKRRDYVLQQLLEIQQQPVKKDVSDEDYYAPASAFEKELEIDLGDYMSVLTRIEEVLDSCGRYPFGIINTKMKIQNLQTEFDHKLFSKYPVKFPAMTIQECHDMAYSTPVVKKMVKLRDDVLERLDLSR